jgi:hypothetical protein
MTPKNILISNHPLFFCEIFLSYGGSIEKFLLYVNYLKAIIASVTEDGNPAQNFKW